MIGTLTKIWLALFERLPTTHLKAGNTLISTSDFKPGLTIEWEDHIWEIVEFLHVKPGKGGAFVRTKLKNFRTGSIIDRTFRAGTRFESAHIERKPMQFLYNQGKEYVFMDMETFDEITLHAEQVGEALPYLADNVEVKIVLHEDIVLGIELPATLELTVTRTDPGLKGDTATGGTKPATLETEAIVQVPLFINQGDVVRVDTRTGEYVERARAK